MRSRWWHLAVVLALPCLLAGRVFNLGCEIFGSLCYQTKPAGGAPKHEKIVGQIHTTSPLTRERADTVKEDELCLPSVPAGGLT